jgi:transposase
MKTKAYLASDVSKGYADFILLDANKQPLAEPFQLDDTPDGRKTLIRRIKEWLSEGLCELYCGLESTGGYENNWFSRLCNLAGRHQKTNQTIKVARLNPKAVKACGEVAMVRTQTDVVSAYNIASYMIGWPEKITYSPRSGDSQDARWLQARQQAGLIDMLSKQKTQLSNQLEKLLYQQLSELLVYCRHGLPGWLMRLLSRYPTRQKLLEAGRPEIAAIRAISPAKAESLLKKLDTQSQTSSALAGHTVESTARQILHLQTQIDNEKDFLTGQFKDYPDVKLLESIRGVGLPSAVRMVVEIQDVTRFKTAKKLCAYFGVHPTWKQSGDGTWKQGMSKQGRPAMRATLYMCGFSGIRCNKLLKKLYHHHRSEGMNHYQAMGVVMHKLLRIVYGILKSKKPYDPQIDRNNRQKAAQKRKQHAAPGKQSGQDCSNNKEENKYATQPVSTGNAPISRQAWKKRKQAASQSSLKKEYTGSPPAT